MGICFSRADNPVTKQRMESKMAALKAGRPWAAPAVPNSLEQHTQHEHTEAQKHTAAAPSTTMSRPPWNYRRLQLFAGLHNRGHGLASLLRCTARVFSPLKEDGRPLTGGATAADVRPHTQVADSGPATDSAGNAEARARARQGRKRIAVAAEALANAADVRIVDIPKSDAVFALLGAPLHRQLRAPLTDSACAGQ